MREEPKQDKGTDGRSNRVRGRRETICECGCKRRSRAWSRLWMDGAT